MGDDRLAEILGDKGSWNGATKVSFDDMEVLMGNGGKLSRLNAPFCGDVLYSEVEYEGGRFFNLATVGMKYDVVRSEFEPTWF